MSLEILKEKPDEYSHFPHDRYTFYKLFNEKGGYGVGAVAEHDDALEVHIEISRWGPQVARSVMEDAAWLRGQAARLGKERVVGVREESGMVPDPRWPKFTRLIGFSGHSLMQVASMEPESQEQHS